MAAPPLNTWCITAAIILGCFLQEIQPREVTRLGSWRNEHRGVLGDRGVPTVKREALVEALYERFFVDSRRNEYTSTAEDQMITDANDTALEIIFSPYEANIRENADPGLFITRFRVHDPEREENDRISCEIDDNHFRLVKNDVARFKIYSYIEVFDHETQTQCTVNVKCQENGTKPRTVRKEITVMILDINDNPPVISINTLYTNGEARIRENAEPGMFVTYVSVYDHDSGDNARFECELDNDHFRLVTLHDTEYKIISTKVLDYEMRTMHKIIITCQDKGWDRRSSTKQFLVNVEDVNDNAPAITIHTNVNGVAKIKEKAEPGTLVTYVSVYDADSGDNGRLNCEITDHHFRLVKLYDSEFTIVSTIYFKHGRSTQYTFDLRCEDSGEEPKSTTKSVVVSVEDVNDHTPFFNNEIYTARIAENMAAGMPVLRAKAADHDTGNNALIHYALDEAANGYFKVDPVSGLISTDTVLHSKETPELHFQVLASDHGSPPRTGSAPVRVTISDVNDNVPVFAEQTYNFAIPENATVGTTIGRVQVAEEDSGLPGVSYYFEYMTDDPFPQFALNASTGDIVLKSPVDFEEQTLFVKTVKAFKAGQQLLKADVKIAITDINDHAPAIAVNTLFTNGGAELSENAEAGTFIAYISVSDADSGDNGRVSCALDDDRFMLVELHDTGFKIVTAALIERDHTIKIMCEDNGEMPLTTTRQVVVNLRSGSE